MSMSERKSFLALTLIMAVACASVIGITLLLTYREHLADERERLAVTAQSQARLMEAVTRFDTEYSSDYAGGSEAATLSQIIDAHENFVGFGETGEFTLAQLEGDQIVFQFRHRHGEVETPAPIPLNSVLAEPMRRALSGRSGTVIGLDYRGVTVLAAHEPVGELNMGIVAKIDMSEVRAPFVRAALAAGGFTLIIVVISTLLFRRIGNPIVLRFQAHVKDLELAIDERMEVEKRLRITQFAVDHASDSVALIRRDGQFANVNESMSRTLGYPREELLVMGVADLDPEFPAEVWPAHWADLKEQGSLTFESRHRTSDGREFPVEILANYVEFEDEEYNFAYARDITQRKRAEERLAASLKEKEVLLREVHHRVKNNMQVITSLLRMHARRSQSPQVQEVFEDCQSRVGAMALVHETLYQSEDLARIDFGVYLEKLCQNLARVHGGGHGNISVVPEAKDVSLGTDQAVAVGMVVSELVSNAFKHAFPEGGEGRIAVSIHETGEQGVELVVEDNGVGLSADVDPDNTDTLGLRLVSAAATGELGGTIEIARGGGTRFTLRFKVKDA